MSDIDLQRLVFFETYYNSLTKVQIPKLENTNYIEKKTLINEREFIRMVLIIFAKMDGQPSSTNSFLILLSMKEV